MDQAVVLVLASTLPCFLFQITDFDMPHITRLDGSLIHYEVKGPSDGPGLPVLLLAPGGIDSAGVRWNQAQFDPGWLDEGRLIFMDQRFAGASSTNLCRYDHQEMAEDAMALLDALEIHRVAVIGEGMGGMQALRLAYDAPARISGGVVVSPFKRPTSLDELYAPFGETIRLARAEGIEAVVAAACNGGTFAENPAAGPWINRLAHDAGFRDAIKRLGREAYITHVVDFRDGLYPWSNTYFALSDVALDRIQIPVAIAAGSQVDAAKDLCQRIQGVEIDLSRESIRSFIADLQ